MEPTPFLNIFEGVEYLLHFLPEAKAPIQQDLFSQREYLRIPSSLRDKEKGSLDDESFSIDEDKGEREHRRSSSVVKVGGDLFSFGDGDEAMASIRGILAPLQGIPKILSYGRHEQHVSLLKENETEQRRGHTADPLS